jgi:DNA-directed RNA polymerase specialized sigma24 family protein
MCRDDPQQLTAEHPTTNRKVTVKTQKLDKLFARLREHRHEYRELEAAPGARPTPQCVPVPRIKEGLDRRDFDTTERAHFGACLWCAQVREKLAPVPRAEVDTWLTGAERLVKYAAWREGDALGLARDDDRERDAYTHAYMKAGEALDADPAVFATEQHARNWLLLAARRFVHDQARRTRARQKYEAEYVRPESASDHSALWAEIRAALPAVSPEARAILVPYLNGQPVKVIARRLKLPLWAGYARLHKALAELRHELDRRGVSAADLCRPSERYAEGTDDPADE